jgi:prepilin peptidase CpaA
VPADIFHWTALAAPVALMTAMALAVRHDLVKHRIPNLLTFGTLAAGLMLAAWTQGLAGLGSALAGAVIGLACLMPLYLVHGMGAGDVKLMAAAGAFLGPFNAFLAAMLTLAAGAVLGVAVLAWRILELRGNSGALASGPVLAQMRKERFPYAAAIAVGVITTLWLRGLLQPLAGSLE